MALDKPAKVYKMIKGMSDKHAEQEGFYCIAVDAGLNPLGVWMAALGTASYVAVHPRDIYREAIKLNAHALFVSHNHPSGSADPSDEDRSLTERIREAGELLGIPMMDHVIIGDDGFYSFASGGK